MSRKTFTAGQDVEIQRDTNASWEPAKYVKRWEEARGWHSVKLPDDAPPKYVNPMSGETIPPEVMADSTDERTGIAVRSFHVGVPTQRLRAAHRKG
jgi:hypothetical protein